MLKADAPRGRTGLRAYNDYVLLDPAPEPQGGLVRTDDQGGVTRYKVLSAGPFVVVGTTQENSYIEEGMFVHMLPQSLSFFFSGGKKVLVGKTSDVLAVEASNDNTEEPYV
jgi:hypothetical protein